MQFHNPFSWVFLILGSVSLAIIPLVWKRRDAPGARPVILMLVGVAIWTYTLGIEMFHTQPEDIFFWWQFQYIGITTSIGTWVLFSLEYTGRTKWLRYRWLFLIEPLIVVALVFTNNSHHLMMEKNIVFIDSMGLVQKGVTQHGVFFWIHAVYSYIILLASVYLMGRAALLSQNLFRSQSGLMLVGMITPLVLNVAYLIVGMPIDPTPFGFAATSITLALSIARFRLFNVIPVARDWLMDNMDDAVVVLDGNNVVVDANAAARRLLVLNGSRASEIIGADAEVAFSGLWSRVSHTVQGQEMRGEVDLGSGTTSRWYEVHVSPLLGYGGLRRYSGRIMIFHDIHHRKQAEEMMYEARDEALQASLLKGQLISNVSHDLRTPLNAILGLTEMLSMAPKKPLHPDDQEKLNMMVSSAQQMNLLVNDLLDQSLIEKGKMTLHNRVFDLNDLTIGVQALAPEANRKGVSLSILVDSDVPRQIMGDMKRLQQIINNLVSNAIKFTDQGEVVVRLFLVDETHWAMEVRDTGCGIPAQAQAYIFEPFRQVDRGENRRVGTGLGLAIVRQLTTMMGGHVELNSEVGKGSTFRVILPLKLNGNPRGEHDRR